MMRMEDTAWQQMAWLDNTTVEEMEYLLSTRQKKLQALRQKKYYYLDHNDFSRSNIYRGYLDRMIADPKLILCLNGGNISHLVLPNGALMDKEQLDNAAWKQEIEGLSDEEYNRARQDRTNLLNARRRVIKRIEAGKKVNKSGKYPPSVLAYKVPKPLVEGLK